MKIKLTPQQIVMLIKHGILKDYSILLNKKSAILLSTYLRQNNIAL